jgi:hypothetical protein
MRKRNLRRLLSHRSTNFGNAMPNADNRSLARSVEKSPAVLGDNPTTFSAGGNWEILLEIAREKSAARRHEMSVKRL